MKVLVATKETQGQRENDFCWCDEGELVQFPTFECTTGSLDDSCGCRRSMCGVDSKRATTTMKVVETGLTEKEIVAKFIASTRQGGWKFDADTVNLLRKDAHGLIEMVEHLPVGTIIERREQLQRRKS